MHRSRKTLCLLVLFTCWLFLYLPVAAQPHQTLTELRQQIEQKLGNQAGVFAVAFKDLATGQELFIREREVFHAASTMKTPVMIEVYKQQAQHKLSLQDSIPIKTEFSSIVDGSLYQLHPTDDSDSTTYKQAGTKRTLASLVYDMITVSSNLATNLIVERVGAPNVTHTMRELGAKDIQVLRGVEDGKAFRQGLNNTTTAYDLMLIFEAIGQGRAVNPEASNAMISTMLEQKFNEVIPAKLPKDVKVAHKTGWVTGVRHDSALVILPDGRKYVLVLLSKEVKDDKAATDAMATVSALIYRHVMQL